MKVVVIGGTGLIGSKLVKALSDLGHDVIAASPNSGVNTVTGEGLETVLSDTHTVVDVANSPSFADDAVFEFFSKSSRNLVAAETLAGVQHHVVLSVVGTDRLQGSGYFRAKAEQERIIKSSNVPYTIVHSTQFFEFLKAIAGTGPASEEIHITPALMQPIASDDVVSALVAVVLGNPQNTIVEIAGPERIPTSEAVQRYLMSTDDSRIVLPDPEVPYFGVVLDDKTLIPENNAKMGSIRLGAWLNEAAKVNKS